MHGNGREQLAENCFSEELGIVRLGASLTQRLDETLAIHVIHEDGFAPVAAGRK